jgi:hypothetical protein
VRHCEQTKLWIDWFWRRIWGTLSKIYPQKGKISTLLAEILNNKSEIAVETSDKGLKIRDNPRFPHTLEQRST